MRRNKKGSEMSVQTCNTNSNNPILWQYAFIKGDENNETINKQQKITTKNQYIANRDHFG